MYLLPEAELIKTTTEGRKDNSATFVVEPLSPGYGTTLGNSLRRVMLSSLEGSAVSAVKIDGVTHEFSTVPNIKEDIVQFVLNLKGLPVRLHSDDPVKIELDIKGPKQVTAKDFKANAQVELVDPNYPLVTLEKNGKIKAEVTIEKGRGFVATERRSEEKLPLGTILVDSVFTPIKKIHYEVVNTRVGSITNFDKLTIDITTNGSITPEEAIKRANQILIDHFMIINNDIKIKEPKAPRVTKKKAAAKKKTVPAQKTTVKTIKKATKKKK